MHGEGLARVFRVDEDPADVGEAGLEPAESEVTMRASTEVELDDETGKKVLSFIDVLEDLDDTQAVYSNADIPDSAYED